MAKSTSSTASKGAVRDADLSELIPDNKNFNRHTEFGMQCLEKSIRANKFGRSVLVDKDNRIIAGNGVVETAAAIGETKIKIVETTGDELVVVKRTDLSLDSKAGREMALADNSVAAVDLDWNEDEIQKAVEDFNIDAEKYGHNLEQEIKETDMQPDEEHQRYRLQLDFTDEDSMRHCYQDLMRKGYDVKIMD